MPDLPLICSIHRLASSTQCEGGYVVASIGLGAAVVLTHRPAGRIQPYDAYADPVHALIAVELLNPSSCVLPHTVTEGMESQVLA